VDVSWNILLDVIANNADFNISVLDHCMIRSSYCRGQN
jgi:hypothetical protein